MSFIFQEFKVTYSNITVLPEKLSVCVGVTREDVKKQSSEFPPTMTASWPIALPQFNPLNTKRRLL